MNTNRKILLPRWPVLLVFLNILFTIPLSSEIDPSVVDFNDYKGLWLTKINNEDIYLLIKKNHEARYFYKDRIDENVYVAKWQLVGETLSVSSINFFELRFCLESYNSELTKSYSEETNISILKKVPEEILGEWSLPPDYKAPKNKYMPSSYFGLWETKDHKIQRVIRVSNNRTVISKIKKNSAEDSEDLIQGEWYKHGQQLHIGWEDGSYSIIDNLNSNYVKLFDFAPGEAIIDGTSEYTLITKLQDDQDNLTNSSNQQKLSLQKNISLSNFDYKSLLKFYRGEWVTLDETQPNAVEIMKLNRFGGINLASDPNTKGSWYLSRNECLINLEDGIRMKLRYIGSAFLLFIYEANRPLDGFPNKILKTAPLHQKKLDMLNAEVYFTLKLLNQVYSLGYNGGESFPLISNWSDRDTINPFPISPWWWPIWSDNPKTKEAENFSVNNLSTPLTNERDFIGSNKESILTNLPNPINKINKSKWEWPF